MDIVKPVTKSARRARKAVVRFFRRIWETGKTLPGIIILGVGLVLLGIWLLERYHESGGNLVKLAGIFSSELGFTFLIAAIIFGIFEEWAAREHGKTAMGHIYGVYPEGPVFDMIEEEVLKQKFYRTGVVVTYKFEEQAGDEVLVCQSIKYRVINVCSRGDEADFLLRGGVDLKPLHTGETPWEETLGLESLRIDDELVPAADIEVRIDKTTCSLSWKLKNPIPLRHTGEVFIEATHRVVKHDHDSAVWTSNLPSTDLQFRIAWNEPLRLKTAVSAIHPKLGDLTPEVEHGSRVVTLKVPFLKGHGIHFRWSPEALADAASTGADHRVRLGA